MEIELLEAVGIVQRCSADAGAGKGHGVEFSHRGDHTGATDLACDANQLAGCFLGRVFERDGPPRRFLCESGGILKAQIIELDHHAVCGVVQRATCAIPIAEEPFHGLQVGQELGIGIHLEAGLPQPLKALPLVVR